MLLMVVLLAFCEEPPWSSCTIGLNGHEFGADLRTTPWRKLVFQVAFLQVVGVAMMLWAVVKELLQVGKIHTTWV